MKNSRTKSPGIFSSAPFGTIITVTVIIAVFAILPIDIRFIIFVIFFNDDILLLLILILLFQFFVIFGTGYIVFYNHLKTPNTKCAKCATEYK